MQIAYLAAGAAGMYCGSCLHDNTLAAALLARGEQVVLAPIYTPLRTDEPDVSQPRVFFGGINAYLQQKIPLFRSTPAWLDGWLDHPTVLKLLAGRAGSVDPSKLGAMTVSMLLGEEGHQRKELDKLVDWLLHEVKPDVVHLSNSMMLGLARRIAAQCGPPVVCSLSGEDLFLEKIPAPYYEQARQALRERAQEVEALIALNNYYADYMADYLAVSREKVAVIPHGLALEGHAATPSLSAEATAQIGFLARICPDKGLHLLVEACQRVLDRQLLPDLHLHIAGYLGSGDRRYFRQIQRSVARSTLRDRVTYHGELTRPEKIAFLQRLHVMSTPTVYRESKGLPVLEAWANGTPVVVPNHGAYPEMVERTGGGLLCQPDDPDDLAVQLATLLGDRPRLAEMGTQAHAAVRQYHTAAQMADQTYALYERLLDASATRG